MHEELDNGQVADWLQYHRQFNLSYEKPDHFWAQLLAYFINANKGENQSDVRPIDMLPWVDPYGDDDEFVASMRAFAATVQPQQVHA
jgi:hypothetical protein